MVHYLYTNFTILLTALTEQLCVEANSSTASVQNLIFILEPSETQHVVMFNESALVSLFGANSPDVLGPSMLTGLHRITPPPLSTRILISFGNI
jgi:hypothetical protein